MRNYLLTVCLVALPLTANSALIDRGNGLIYDDLLDITWLQDANYDGTFRVDGKQFSSRKDAEEYVDEMGNPSED